MVVVITATHKKMDRMLLIVVNFVILLFSPFARLIPQDTISHPEMHQ